MATHQWLSRAPLVEATVELSFGPWASPRDDAGALAQALAERYPRAEARAPDGHRFRGDALYAVEAWAGGMTVSRLAPYTGFGPLVGEALWAWERTLDVARPPRIRRLAVRFQNRFELGSTADLDRRFPTAPRVAPALAPDLRSLESRLRFACGEDTTAVLAQRLPHARERARFELDIDVERVVDLAPDSDRVWRSLGELAAIEHRLFFESVTEEALGPYV
jgi:uncharacterized protein (TIGR04255 family)